MTQNALVVRIIDECHAEISLERASACGSACDFCGGFSCDSRNEIKASAVNMMSARQGDYVSVRSTASAADLVYLLPPCAFLLGYLLSSIAGCRENILIFISIGSFSLGAGLSYYIRKTSRHRVTFKITGIL